MTDALMVAVAGLLVIAGATLIGPRLGIASPLVLTAIGVAVSFLPMFATVRIDPEWILSGVLPPLLYSSAVSMPSMNFRREFGAIGGLSVLLVVATAVVLGVFFTVVIPGLGFAWAVTLGAIVSPTDAVATSIIKRLPVSKRVVAMLDGESLLNDASALVLLRTAIVATAASFSFWGAVGTFAHSVAVAVVLGGVVGWLNLTVRRHVRDPTVNTVISFTVPFIASVPAEVLGGSGLVAAVVAGLVTGFRAPRDLSPQSRASDLQNWHTVELVLEGAVFLTMGLQIASIIATVEQAHAGTRTAVIIAAGALVLTILVRAAFVGPLLGVLSARARRSARMKEHMQGLQERLSSDEGKQQTREEMGARGRRVSERQLEYFARRVTRGLATIDYFLRQPLGWREGSVIVWSGMRGAVTVAAAQTLPSDAPQRSVLVLIAFAVALMSLGLQGGTAGPLVRRLTSDEDQAAAQEQERAERAQIRDLMRTSAAAVPAPARTVGEDPFESSRRHRLTVLEVQRSALLDARDNGTFDADVLARELANLDAAQIALEMREG